MPEQQCDQGNLKTDECTAHSPKHLLYIKLKNNIT